MVDLGFFLKGFGLGFAIAAPVGPIGLLCIRRSLVLGVPHGLLTGLGAATADSLYGLIGAFSVTWVATFLVQNDFVLKLCGGGFLMYLGIKILFAPSATALSNNDSSSLIKSYLTSLFLTITNPMTIMSFSAAFLGLGLSKTSSPKNSFLMVLGVFVGSALWWLILSTIVGFFRLKMGERIFKLINRFSGILLLGFAVRAFIGLF